MAWKGWKPAPLPSSFMLTAILGFIISAMWVFPQSTNWGFTFFVFFTIMFIASVVSMAHAPVDELAALDKDTLNKQKPHKKRKKKR